MPITITITAETASEALSEMDTFLFGLAAVDDDNDDNGGMTAEDMRRAMATAEDRIKKLQIAKDELALDGAPVFDDPQPAPTARERGKPSPGRARRTKEEIAEDEAADRADAAKAAGEPQAAISTGENRVGPEDSPEDAAQDAADEKAEAEASRKADAPLTHDDVRQALGDYVKKYGMASAQEDGPKLITLAFGEGKVKISDIPNDQASLLKAVSGVREMLAKNPFQRTPTGGAFD